jgi:hypothetical protein
LRKAFQFGILKRLRGTPIIRHTDTHKLIFDPNPPYTILATDCIDFPTMQRLVRFARYWDLIANSGRFAHTLQLILDHAPFARFLALSDWLYAQTNATHQIALSRLATLVSHWLSEQGVNPETIQTSLARDYAGRVVQEPQPQKAASAKPAAPLRQNRHLTAKPH